MPRLGDNNIKNSRSNNSTGKKTRKAPSCSSASPRSNHKHASMGRPRNTNKDTAAPSRPPSLVERIQYEYQVRHNAFLATTPVMEKVDHQLTFFHRSEIRTAPTPLGRGGFSVVYEIVGFCLDDSISRQLPPQAQELRLWYQQTARDPVTGQGRFVIKHLRRPKHQREATKSPPRPGESRDPPPRGGHRRHQNGECVEEEDEYHGYMDESMAVPAAYLALEAAYMMRLDHPNILSLRGLPAYGIHSFAGPAPRYDDFFILLDRLDTDLNQALQQGPWTTDHNDTNDEHDESTQRQRLEYSRQLASALQYLHQRGIIFRDLKPHNVGFVRDYQQQQQQQQQHSIIEEGFEINSQQAVLLDDTSITDDNSDSSGAGGRGHHHKKSSNLGSLGQLKLFDFGLCRWLPTTPIQQPASNQKGNKTNKKKKKYSITTELFRLSGVGTQRYAAPEAMRREPYNAKVDAYGWAMVTWQMFSLVKPYGNYSPQQHLLHVCHNGERPPLTAQDHGASGSTIPPYLHNVLKQAWHADWEERSDMNIICHQLHRLLDDRRFLGSYYSRVPSSLTAASPNSCALWWNPKLHSSALGNNKNNRGNNNNNHNTNKHSPESQSSRKGWWQKRTHFGTDNHIKGIQAVRRNVNEDGEAPRKSCVAFFLQ